jgi:hypothetical protein
LKVRRELLTLNPSMRELRTRGGKKSGHADLLRDEGRLSLPAWR